MAKTKKKKPSPTLHATKKLLAAYARDNQDLNDDFNLASERIGSLLKEIRELEKANNDLQIELINANARLICPLTKNDTLHADLSKFKRLLICGAKTIGRVLVAAAIGTILAFAVVYAIGTIRSLLG